MTDVPVNDYYDRLAADYDESRFGHAYGRHIDRLEQAILRRWLAGVSPENVVDIGCGTGRLLGFAGTGVDQSAEMLKIAAGKHPDRRLVRSDLPALDLPDGAFAAATCFHVFMHLDEALITASLGEVARVVKPGGRLIFDIPSRLRRALRRKRRAEVAWHAETSAGRQDVERWAGDAWRIVRRTGILVLPMHRVPAAFHGSAGALDALLGGGLLEALSSYHVYELERRA